MARSGSFISSVERMKLRFQKFDRTEVRQGIDLELARPEPLDSFVQSLLVLKYESNPPSVGGFKTNQSKPAGAERGGKTEIERLIKIFMLHISALSFAPSYGCTLPSMATRRARQTKKTAHLSDLFCSVKRYFALRWINLFPWSILKKSFTPKRCATFPLIRRAAS